MLYTTFQKNQSCLQNPNQNTNLLRFHARSSENVNISLCIANFQLIKGPRILKLTGFFLHFSPFHFFKMVATSHFCLHFSIFQIKISFFSQNGCRWPFRCPKFIFFCISRHFRSKRNFHFCFQNGRRRPFWMSEIHFRLHFSPFQIKMQFSFLLP